MAHPSLARSESGRCLYRPVLTGLSEAGIAFLLGGTYALEHYTGLARRTKDLDLFVRPDDAPQALATIEAQGWSTDMPFPHWLGKARKGGSSLDIIFGAGNGVARVDDDWFRFAERRLFAEIEVPVCPVEEMIWQKAFVMERERFDGADVVNLLRARADSLDWRRLVWRFDRHWRVLLSHVVLFGFVFPDRQGDVPQWVIAELTTRLADAPRDDVPHDDAVDGNVCFGTLLSREQYLESMERYGYRDARQVPTGTMSEADLKRWTAAIE